MMLLSLSAAAWAYGEAVHRTITAVALAPVVPTEAAPPLAPDGPARIRAALDADARANAELAPAWSKRWPTAENFDAYSEKELLLFSQEANVYGIDRVDVVAPEMLDVLAEAAREPDDDRRNRDRLAHGPDRSPIAGVPADPAILNMGRIGMLSSQAHAHYGLKQIEFSEDSEVLKSDPPRFAVASGYPKGKVITLAAEMAQEHIDLAMLAALDGQPTLAALYTGQAFHYLEDVCNPIHTVQVGLYDFFFDAFKARMKMSLLSGGGYFGPLRSLASIGIDELSSHHTLSENLTQKHLLIEADPVSARLRKAMTDGDAELQADFDKLTPDGEFAMAAVRAVIDRSAPDGAPMYAATRGISVPKLREEGVKFDDEKDDPDAFVVPRGSENDAAWTSFWDLQERSFRRAGAALRKVKTLEDKAISDATTTPEGTAALRVAVSERLARRQLKMLDEADARLADYRAHPPDSATKPERMPGMLAGEVGFVGLICGVSAWLMRRRRR